MIYFSQSIWHEIDIKIIQIMKHTKRGPQKNVFIKIHEIAQSTYNHTINHKIIFASKNLTNF